MAEQDKILVIDDSAVQAEFLRSILKEDYDVTTCQTAAEGLSLAGSGEFSLVLLDVILPDMDGFTLLKRLMETDLHTPVIMITSLSDIQHEERGLTLGAVDYVTKPFSPIIIRARVNTHIKLYHYRLQFRRQAMVDELTGVANRRRYEAESLIKWREAVRFGLPFSVAMMDIDKFKVYNDTFGHPAGDKVIAAVAKTVSSRLRRATDFFARYGGEEFVAIHLGDEADIAFSYAKSIRQAVEDLHMPHDPSVSPWVTISMGGVTVRPQSGDVYGDCLKVADDMLYRAKELGRNQVVWSPDGKSQWAERG